MSCGAVFLRRWLHPPSPVVRGLTTDERGCDSSAPCPTTSFPSGSCPKSLAAIIARSCVLLSLLPTTLPPPKDEPLCGLTFLLRRQQKRRKHRPKASAAAPIEATTMPAIWGLLRDGLEGGPEDVDAGAAIIEEGGWVVDEDGEPVAATIAVSRLDADVDTEEDEEVESREELEAMLV